MERTSGHSLYFRLLAGTVLVVSFGCQASKRPVAEGPEAVLAQLVTYVGNSPVECGRHRLFGNWEPSDSLRAALNASVECVVAAGKAQKTSWMVMELQGIDSFPAIGLISDRDGAVHLFDYDSDPSGGGGAAPRTDLSRCAAPAINLQNQFRIIECATPSVSLPVEQTLRQ